MVNMWKLFNDASDSIMFWHELNGYYNKWNKLYLTLNNDNEKNVASLTDMFSELHKKILKDTNDKGLDFLQLKPKATVESLQKELADKYSELSKQQGTPSTDNIKDLCNITLNLIEKYREGYLEFTKSLLNSNIDMLARKMDRNYGK